MRRPRILLADDHTLMLEGLRKLLEPEGDLVGAVEDGRALLDAAARLRPDIIVLDISMPLLNGIEAARRLRETVPECRLIFLTMHADPTYAAEAFRAGASGYVLKRSAASELSQAIAAARRGQFYVTPLIAKDGLDPLLAGARREPPKLGSLTPRQREVLQLLAEGHVSKEIAAILGISVKTVEFHKSRLMRQLGVRSSAELTKYAVTHGITSL